jgi:hypothetical protein
VQEALVAGLVYPLGQQDAALLKGFTDGGKAIRRAILVEFWGVSGRERAVMEWGDVAPRKDVC